MDLEKDKGTTRRRWTSRRRRPRKEEMDDGAINLSQATTMELATRFGKPFGTLAKLPKPGEGRPQAVSEAGSDSTSVQMIWSHAVEKNR